jgi:glycosyltransferase involved in cell wall biosynthesis
MQTGKVLFIGMVFRPEDESFVFGMEKGQPQVAANKLGWLFIDGLRTSLQKPVDVISVLMVSRFPIFRKLVISRLGCTSPEGTFCYASFLNIPLLKRLFILISVLRRASAWARQTNDSSRRSIFTYAVYLPTLIPAVLVGKLTKSQVILIVPDLPEFMQPGVRFSGLIEAFRTLNYRLCYYFASFVDGFIFLTSAMAERFDVRARPWVVVEGCIDPRPMEDLDASSLDSTVRSIFYSGTLNRAYGLELLLSAFEKMPGPDLQLVICGRGELQDEIIERARRDGRIRYMGALPNRGVVKLQRRSTVLVNPRPSDSEFTRFSFPSKTLEYMTSGRPVVCCRLPGIRAEYWDYLIPFERENAEGFAETLTALLRKPAAELDRIGKNGRNFVLENKTPEKQMRRALPVFGLKDEGLPAQE